jgi:hypothetical protein
MFFFGFGLRYLLQELLLPQAKTIFNNVTAILYNLIMYLEEEHFDAFWHIVSTSLPFIKNNTTFKLLFNPSHVTLIHNCSYFTLSSEPGNIR